MITRASIVGMFLLSALTLGAQSNRSAIGREVSVPTHLRDGQELSIPLAPWSYMAPDGVAKRFTTVTHHQHTDASGRTIIEKAGAGPFSKNANDPTSTY